MECGKEVEGEEELKGSLCLECFLERNSLMTLPDVVDLVRCPDCGATYGRGGWGNPRDPGVEHDPDEMDQDDAGTAAEDALQIVDGGLVRSVQMRVRHETPSIYRVDVEAEVGFMGQVVPAQASTRVRIKGEMCQPCSRKAGMYFEAVIQLRGTKDRPATADELERARAFVMDEIDRLGAQSRGVALVKIEELHGGLDFYLTSHSAGAQVAKSLCGMYSASSSTSTTMAGRRDGREIVRATHLVRMPELRRGDYVMLRDQMLRVISARPKDVTVEVTAGTGKRRHLGRAEQQQLTFVGDADSAEEAVLVSATDTEVQVLDPLTLSTVDVILPEGYEVGGRETVLVVRTGDGLFLVG
ncbi:MAG: hypothetical protein KAS77_10415 [Thermoplasmata archaeon]|nr:hypothetical protein [Thermoplasmata archaeon]